MVMSLMQVRYSRPQADLMTQVLDHCAATSGNPELRQFAAEHAALFRYRQVRLWGLPAVAIAAPVASQGATVPPTGAGRGDGSSATGQRAKRPARRRQTVPDDGAQDQDRDGQRARAS